MITMLLGGLWHGRGPGTFCGVGRAARRVSLHQSRLEQLWPPRFAPRFAPAGESCRLHSDVFLVGRRRVGVFFRAPTACPRRSMCCRKMTDPTQIAFRPALKWPYALFIMVYAAIAVVCPETRKPSWVTITRTGRWGQRFGRVARRSAPAFLYAAAAVLVFSGFSESISTANSSISGF